jgi:hypothetical protein
MMNTPAKSVFPVPGKDAMTVPEYFAAMALQGILAGPLSGGEKSPIRPNDAAKWAIEYADALLDELH